MTTKAKPSTARRKGSWRRALTIGFLLFVLFLTAIALSAWLTGGSELDPLEVYEGF